MKNSLFSPISGGNSELLLESLVNPLGGAIGREDENSQHKQADQQRPEVFAGKNLPQDHL
jgi:hypothetical protein